MPANKEDAIRFLETQWSSINENKIKGIKAETEFRQYLEANNIHFIPGGWILIPGKNTNVVIPSQHKICLLPMEADFSWAPSERTTTVTPALMSAYNYFRQVGITAYIVVSRDVDESQFINPEKRKGSQRAVYPRPYEMIFQSISPGGEFNEVNFQDVFSNFPNRNGNIGLKSYEQERIDRTLPVHGELVI